MKIGLKVAGVALLCLGAVLSVQAKEKAPGRWSAAFGMGRGSDDVDVYRGSLQYGFKPHWLKSDAGYLHSRLEITFSVWEGEDEDNWGLFYSPVFMYSFDNGQRAFIPYLEAGIGVGFISKTFFQGRKLSTAFQFEDRLGGGVRFGRQQRHDLNVRYVHYSNASLKNPNAGLDTWVVSYGYRF